MTYQYHPPNRSALEGKVVVLTGGAAGIGAATVRQLHTAGAHVFFGDVQDEAAASLEKELSSGSAVKYIRCDVRVYEDNLRLFKTAYDSFGRIDHAWSNAGITEQGNIFDPELDLESVQQEPTKSMSVLDINLKGPIYFARIASVYLRQGEHQDADKSLTLTSSVGGFREDPGLWVYVPSKHGVLGLMRMLRRPLAERSPRVRTNAICPWFTRTRVSEGVAHLFEHAGLPRNSPEDVAKIVVGVLADEDLNGASIYVEGGRAWNIEEGLLRTRPQWLGERQTVELDRGTEVLGSGQGWVKNQQ
ncbi:Hypothetical predicted protein [Lecanosticta acicola]|uniref:3-hydroxyacyl-CoA dehydrogenase n=1 Tax=Lecanosticta acicola TaxID=111012 RepID=A0AAI8YS44_9PEZI|nr:Hypothetical predicted protein [Lecanosticta acicola]